MTRQLLMISVLAAAGSTTVAESQARPNRYSSNTQLDHRMRGVRHDLRRYRAMHRYRTRVEGRGACAAIACVVAHRINGGDRHALRPLQRFALHNGDRSIQRIGERPTEPLQDLVRQLHDLYPASADGHRTSRPGAHAIGSNGILRIRRTRVGERSGAHRVPFVVTENGIQVFETWRTLNGWMPIADWAAAYQRRFADRSDHFLGRMVWLVTEPDL